MNRQRRAQAGRIDRKIEELLEDIDDLIIEEEDTINRLPENFQKSRGKALEFLLKAQDELMLAQEYLQSANSARN